MKPAHVIRANAPLLGAVVRMNDLGVRQLVVVDPKTETQFVGVLAMSDLVRAHASAKAMVRSNTSKMNLLDPLDGQCAETIMVPSTLVPAAAKVSDLAARLHEGPAQALIVHERDHGFGIVLPEYLSEFSHDEELERMLIAGDVARPASSAGATDNLSSLARTMVSHGTEAVVVLNAAADPIGVVTKNALALAFLDAKVSALQPEPSR